MMGAWIPHSFSFLFWYFEVGIRYIVKTVSGYQKYSLGLFEWYHDYLRYIFFVSYMLFIHIDLRFGYFWRRPLQAKHVKLISHLVYHRGLWAIVNTNVYPAYFTYAMCFFHVLWNRLTGHYCDFSGSIKCIFLLSKPHHRPILISHMNCLLTNWDEWRIDFIWDWHMRMSTFPFFPPFFCCSITQDHIAF